MKNRPINRRRVVQIAISSRPQQLAINYSTYSQDSNTSQQARIHGIDTRARKIWRC